MITNLRIDLQALLNIYFIQTKYLLDPPLCVRLRGGVVVVDRLTRDSQGTLLVNLDRFDREVVAETSFGPGERCGLVTEI